jgi:O-methyltransferase involved in polyketide biosynthesis
VIRSLSAIAAQHSRLAFDYMDMDAFDPGTTAPQVQRLKDILRSMGEPMKTGLDPGVLEKELRGVGWELRENLSPEDIEKIYFRGYLDGYRARKHIHFALAVIPGKSGEVGRA